MQLSNETPFVPGWTTGFDRDGRELLVVVVKGTFELEPGREEPRVAAEQVPLVKSDEYSGEPGRSAPIYESDYAHRKPLCDVLLNGSAWAPEGRPTRRVTVGLAVGSMRKSFEVVGNRVWSHGAMTGTVISAAEPFVRMPISYDVAFGGLDDTDPNKVATFLANPIGRGFALDPRRLDGTLLPNTEAIGQPIQSSSGKYSPMALGPIGRNWQPRMGYVGTYDKSWLDDRAPFWPDDFDYRYFQAAPPDQQIPAPVGGEPIVLLNLGAAGRQEYRLPKLRVPILLVERGSFAEYESTLDTIVLEPDLGRMCLSWRLCHPLRRDPFEIRELVIGGRSGAWKARQRALLSGKTYYRNLAEAVADRKRRRPRT